MKKFLFILLLVCFSVHAMEDDARPVGWKHHASLRQHSILKGALILGHLGLNVMAAYFQTEQMPFLEKIPYPDNEMGVAEEDKRCSQLCQENSALIRSNSEHAYYFNALATVTSAASGLFNVAALGLWIAMQSNWEKQLEYTNNVDKFARIALGISVVNALFNIATTGLMAQSIAYHRDDLPLRTLAPLQVATTTGVGYWLPMILFSGYGVVKVGQVIEAARFMSNEIYEIVPKLKLAIDKILTTAAVTATQSDTELDNVPVIATGPDQQ
jgi:hypothetical protein